MSRRVIPLSVDLSAPPAAARAMPPPPKSPLARARSPGEGARPPTGGSVGAVGLAGGFDRLMMMRQVNVAVSGPATTTSSGGAPAETSAALNHRQRMAAEQQRRQELALMAREDYTGTAEGQARLQRQEERSRMREEELRTLQLLEAERQAERQRQRQRELEEEAAIREQYMARLRAQREEQQRAAEEKEAARKLAVERKMRSLKEAADAKARAEFAEKQWVLEQEALLARERHQAAVEMAHMQVEDALGLAMQHQLVAERERQRQIAAEQEEWRAFQEREQEKQREATRVRRAAMAQQYEQDKQRRLQIHKLQRERAAQHKERRKAQKMERPDPDAEMVGTVGAAADAGEEEHKQDGKTDEGINASVQDDTAQVGRVSRVDGSTLPENQVKVKEVRPEPKALTTQPVNQGVEVQAEVKTAAESLPAASVAVRQEDEQSSGLRSSQVKEEAEARPTQASVSFASPTDASKEQPSGGESEDVKTTVRVEPPKPNERTSKVKISTGNGGENDPQHPESTPVEGARSKAVSKLQEQPGTDENVPANDRTVEDSTNEPSGASNDATSDSNGRGGGIIRDVNPVQAESDGPRVVSMPTTSSPSISQPVVVQEKVPVDGSVGESVCPVPGIEDTSKAAIVASDTTQNSSTAVGTEAKSVELPQATSTKWSVAAARENGVAPFAQVTSVTEHSPAMQATLRSGDLLVDFGGITSTTPKCLMAMAECVQKNVNCPIAVGLLRQVNGMSPIGALQEDDHFQEVRVTLRPRKWRGKGLLGCQLSPFTWPDKPLESSTDTTAGNETQDTSDGTNVLVVYDIVTGSVAEQAGLLNGDLLAGCGELDLSNGDMSATIAAVAEHIQTTRSNRAVVHLDIHRWIVDEQCYRLLHIELPSVVDTVDAGGESSPLPPLGCSLTSFSEYYNYLSSSTSAKSACAECYYTTLTTALHAAALNGHVACLEVLLASLKQQGAAGGYSARDYLDWRDEDGRTPLFYACYASQVDCVRFLLEQTTGSDGSSGAGADWYGDTVLHAAATSGDASVVALVLESALVSVDERNHARLTCAHVAPNVEVLALLGERFEADLLTTDTDERMPLAYACLRNDVASVEYLCRKHPDFVDYADAQGNTPLHVAAWLGLRETAEVLVHFLPSIALYLTNADGRSAAEEARASGMTDVAAFLEEVMAAADANAAL